MPALTTMSNTLYEVLKKNLQPIEHPVLIKGGEIAGGLLVAELGTDICERCHFNSDDDLSIAISDLLSGGTIFKKVIGKRSVLVLGEWRLLKGPVRYKEIFFYKCINGKLLLHEIELEIENLLTRYNSKQVELIKQVFDEFASMRRGNKISKNIYLNQLLKWRKYDTSLVEQAIKTFIVKDMANEGKGENYCLGIMRSLSKQDWREVVQDRVNVNSGFEALEKRREQSKRDRS